MLQPGFSAHYLITSHVTICPGQSHHDMLHLPEAILESDHAVDLRCAFCSNAWHVSWDAWSTNRNIRCAAQSRNDEHCRRRPADIDRL
jgi:hypothetical protein